MSTTSTHDLRTNPAPQTESALVPTFVGRQPIFNSNIEIYAHEILFRNSIDNEANYSDSDFATGQSFWNTFMELGIENVCEDGRAYLNVTRLFILSGCVKLFPADVIALEVPCFEADDSELIRRIQELSREGYRIVLDGLKVEHLEQEYLAVIHEAKVDALETSAADFKLIMKSRPKQLRIIAKNIETFDKFEKCRKLGCDNFQGFFLSRPQIVAGGRLAADSMTRMKLLSAVNDPETEIEELEQAISQDVALSYKFLRYVNSAMFSLSTEIESIHHAVMIMGQSWVRTWTNLVILSGISDKPKAVFSMAVVRAKMCELLAREIGAKNPETFFTTGLFSCLDALLDRPLDEILDSLPLADDLNQALMNHKGSLGEALDCALGYERSAWNELSFAELDGAQIRDAYIESLQWAADLRGVV